MIIMIMIMIMIIIFCHMIVNSEYFFFKKKCRKWLISQGL